MTRRTIPAAAAAVLAAGLLGACGSSTGSTATTTNSTGARTTASATGQAAALTVTDGWVKAADSGMTGGFGILKNTGSTDLTVVSATSPVAAMMELHETVSNGSGGTVMRAKQGGFVVPAGASLELKPGGNHVMFMSLTSALKSGTTTTYTLKLADGSTLAVTAPVRTFSGAQESYAPSATTGSGMTPGATMSHG